MEQNKRGGKRVGAGRKSLPVSEKKTVLTLYPTNADLYKFGSKEKMCGEILKFISGYGKPVETVHFPDTSGAFQDLTKSNVEIKPVEQPKTNYEVKMPPKPETLPIGDYEGFRKRILATDQRKPLEEIMREVKSALLNGRQKMELEQIAKEHSKDFFND